MVVSGSGLAVSPHRCAVAAARYATVAPLGKAAPFTLPAVRHVPEFDGGAHSFESQEPAGRVWRAFSMICVSGYDRDGRLRLNDLSKGTLVDIFS